MPYISDENGRRRQIDKIVEIMYYLDVKADGDLNYILYAYCKRYIKPSYNNFKNFCGELRQCATEIERRLVAPYEDKKIRDNGDVK